VGERQYGRKSSLQSRIEVALDGLDSVAGIQLTIEVCKMHGPSRHVGSDDALAVLAQEHSRDSGSGTKIERFGSRTPAHAFQKSIAQRADGRKDSILQLFLRSDARMNPATG
jgi:hypothetical protein